MVWSYCTVTWYGHMSGMQMVKTYYFFLIISSPTVAMTASAITAMSITNMIPMVTERAVTVGLVWSERARMLERLLAMTVGLV